VIKITRVIERPREVFMPPDAIIEANLYVEIDIDGYSWALGGLPATWSRQDILNHVNSDYGDILRQAKQKDRPTQPALRTDLMDAEFVPRDMSGEIDDLKARVEAIEGRVPE